MESMQGPPPSAAPAACDTIGTPRHSRGFFLCGRSPMLLAAPAGAFAICQLRGACYLLPLKGSTTSFIVIWSCILSSSN